MCEGARPGGLDIALSKKRPRAAPFFRAVAPRSSASAVWRSSPSSARLAAIYFVLAFACPAMPGRSCLTAVGNPSRPCFAISRLPLSPSERDKLRHVLRPSLAVKPAFGANATAAGPFFASIFKSDRTSAARSPRSCGLFSSGRRLRPERARHGDLRRSPVQPRAGFIERGGRVPAGRAGFGSRFQGLRFAHLAFD